MRVAFCGASGTGKTTLAKYLAAELDVPLNPVGSRTVATMMGFDNPYDVDRACLEEYQYWLARGVHEHEAALHAMGDHNDCEHEETVRGLFQRNLQEAKIRWETQAVRGFVSDRTTVDDMVYCALHNHEAIDGEFINRAREHLRSYDLIFFTPTWSFHNLAGDPNRVAEIGYHDLFETFAEGTLVVWLGSDWNEKVSVVHLSELEHRRSFCLAQVEARRDFMIKQASRTQEM